MTEIRPKRRRISAIGLGLGFLDTALYLNQLIREPGLLSARRPSLFARPATMSNNSVRITSNMKHKVVPFAYEKGMQCHLL